MNILIAGGTGFLGSYLKKRFEESSNVVRVISRAGGDVSWDEKELISALENTDVLINLAGKSIDCRFTDENKHQILNSRIETTALLKNAVSKCKNTPKIWINASATGIYKHTIDKKLNEYSVEFADDFLGKVVQKWEESFFSFDIPGIKKVALRTSVVLGKSGGVFPLLNRLSMLGAGGKQGNGNQMFSWIYVEDYFRIIQLIIANETINGVVNATAPNPVTNKYLMAAFKKTNKAIFAISSPKILLKIASYFLDFQPDLVLDSTYVNSQKLEDLNFEFTAPTVEKALELLNKNEK